LFAGAVMFGLGKYLALAGGVALALVLAWGLRVDHLRAGWKLKFETVVEQTGVVTASIRRATGNPKLKWKDASAQVDALAASRDGWKSAAETQTAAIDRMGAEADRLKALNAELRARAEKEIARRTVAIDRLDNQALTAGDRDNCQQQIAAAEAALDAIYEEGL
jgi:hypothetical protein